MKKRIVLLLVVATMSIGMLAGCGEEEDTTEEIGTTMEENKEKPEVKEETETEAEPTEPADTPAPTEEPETEPEKPEYTYTDMSATMYAQKSVNVRDLPNTDGAKLGALSVNQEVKVTGQCNETSWYRIEYKGSVAYVSNNYLGDNKVEEKKPEPKPDTSANNNPTPAPSNPEPKPEANGKVCSAGHDTSLIYNAYRDGDYYYCELYVNKACRAPSNMLYGQIALWQAQTDAQNAGLDAYLPFEFTSQETLSCGCIHIHVKFGKDCVSTDTSNLW